MNVEFFKSHLSGKIDAPASKSYAHRLLIAAALSNKEVIISHIDFCDDVNATIDCLKQLGKAIEINQENHEVILSGSFKFQDQVDFTILESGSTLRFMIPLSLIYTHHLHIKTTPRLIKRGIGLYHDILKDDLTRFDVNNDEIIIEGSLSSGYFEIPGNVSSQYITGMMMALPLVDGDSKITIIPPVESFDYLNLTADVLKKAGINIQFDNSTNNPTYQIKGHQSYLLPDSIVEFDASNTAFLEALSLIDGPFEINGVSNLTLQGDIKYQEYFQALKEGTPTIDIKDNIDLGPILMSVAAFYHGAKLINTHRLEIKESNRGEVTKNELSKFGASIELLDNEIIIHKVELHPTQELLNANNDHRIIMSLIPFALKHGGIIQNFEAINKSYPGLLNDLLILGACFKIYD